jgi:ABC-2 type transport system permease protein
MSVLQIAWRDLSGYLTSLYGYAIIAIILFIDGLLFNALVLGGDAEYSTEILRRYFYLTFGCTMFAAWLLSMRSVAEERQNGTVTVLQSSPVKDWQIILGKWLAVMGMMTVFLVCTLHMPTLIVVNGKVAWAHVAVGYAGLFCVASAATAIGVFGSALAPSQEAAVFTSGTLLVVMLAAWMLSNISEPPLAEIVEYVALYEKHFQPFEKGSLMLSHVVYYGSITWLFLLLATRAFEWRRWR